jgi:hypothetical protein
MVRADAADTGDTAAGFATTGADCGDSAAFQGMPMYVDYLVFCPAVGRNR